MIVTSALELYTQAFAWHMYTATALILFGTGLALIPFVLVTIDTLLDSWENDWDSERLIKSLEMQVYTMLLVVFFALSPSINISFSGAQYAYSSCKADDEERKTEVKDGETGTKFDKEVSKISAIYSDRQPKAPLWWYTTVKLWQGLSAALIQEIPCTADLTSISYSLATTPVKDPALQEELTQFYGDCYLKATNQFLNNIPPEDEKPAGLKGDDIFDDVAWLGSRFFTDNPNYYSVLRPTKEVKAFPYSELRDQSISPPPPDGVEAGGYPSCYEWWTGVPPEGSASSDTDGLQNRLIAHIKSISPDDFDSSFMDAFKYDNADEAEQDRLRIALSVAPSDTDPLSLPKFSNASISSNPEHPVASSVTTFLENAAAASSGISQGKGMLVETAMIRNAASNVEALVKMMFTLLLPILMFLSLYNIKTLITLTAVQLSFYLWSYIFAICFWLNSFLMASLIENNPVRNLFGPLGQLTDANFAPQLTLMWIVMYSYIIIPLWFSAIITVTGRNLGSGIENKMFSMGGLGKGSTKLPNFNGGNKK